MTIALPGGGLDLAHREAGEALPILRERVVGTPLVVSGYKTMGAIGRFSKLSQRRSRLDRRRFLRDLEVLRALHVDFRRDLDSDHLVRFIVSFAVEVHEQALTMVEAAVSVAVWNSAARESTYFSHLIAPGDDVPRPELGGSDRGCVIGSTEGVDPEHHLVVIETRVRLTPSFLAAVREGLTDLASELKGRYEGFEVAFLQGDDIDEESIEEMVEERGYHRV